MIGKDDEPVITAIRDGLDVSGIKKGDWNDVHVFAKANVFKFYINGKLASEFTEHLPESKRLKSGMIQLQLHDPGMVVEFKDIKLKVLK